jgi:hypothetical protein
MHPHKNAHINTGATVCATPLDLKKALHQLLAKNFFNKVDFKISFAIRFKVKR